MSYAINFWTFQKKVNSTEQPDPRYMRANVNAELMNDSGLLNPTFKFNPSPIESLNVDIKTLNYAYVAEFERYYYITNWRYDRGLWICEMQEDVLASQKYYIGQLQTYVLRATGQYDPYLPDNMYPTKVGATFSAITQINNPFASSYSAGYFVVGIINGDLASYGAVSYYVFTSGEFRTFAYYVLGSTNIYSATEISNQLMKLLFNPFQYIVSCTWLPVAPPMGASVSSINIGWWEITGVSAHRLSGSVRTSGTVTIQIPRHPDSDAKKYLQAEPYTQYYLDFPPFGNVSIPANYLVNASYIDFAWNCDCITGDGKLMIGAGNAGQPFNILHGQIGVPVQLAQMTPDISGAIQQILPNTNNQQLDTIINTLGNIGSAYLQTMLPMQTTGHTGGFSAGYYPIRLTGIFASIADSDINEFGAPLCKTVILNDLGYGYILCAHGDFKGDCTLIEREQINSYLTSGFYLE